MAQDATGTPSAKGIPKFNTAVDAPSGKGTNAIVDAIDTLLDSYVLKPASIATGEVPVWNGSTFARSSVTRITTVRPQDLTQDGASSGQVLAWNGSIWAPGSAGGEKDYVEKTSNTSITATTEGTANTIVTGASVSYDGSTAVMIEFFAPAINSAGGSGNSIVICLYEDGSSVGQLGTVFNNGATALQVPVFTARRRTPSNGSHTYSIRAFVNTGTGTVSAGAGGSGASFPCYMRIKTV